jgi:hypothetical protein
MLGHAKASMPLDVYAGLFDEDLDSVAANLDAAIRFAAYPLRTRCVPGPLKTRASQPPRSHQPGPNSVELRGIEPLTYSMRTSRATNCAIAPDR